MKGQAERRDGSTTPPDSSGFCNELRDRKGQINFDLLPRAGEQRCLTDVSQVDQAVLADVGAGAGLRGDDATATATLMVADDAELRGLDATGQVHVEDGAQLLQQLHTHG